MHLEMFHMKIAGLVVLPKVSGRLQSCYIFGAPKMKKREKIHMVMLSRDMSSMSSGRFFRTLNKRCLVVHGRPGGN